MRHFLFFFCILVGTASFAQITLIPDENFEAFLISEGIDTDGVLNGQVTTADVENVTELNVINKFITDFTGLEDFAALEIFNCSENFDLVGIDLSNNSMLREFYGEFTSLSTLDVSENSALEILYIPHNNLTALTFSNNPALEILVCGNPEQDIEPFNQITTIDFKGAPNLLSLDVSYMFEDIDFDLSLLPLLETFYGRYCKFESLDFSNNTNLETIVLGGFDGGIIFGQSNNLTEIDLSNNPNIKEVDVDLTNINSLNLKNGNNAILTTMRANLNDPLFCIQVDDETAANNGDAPYGDWDVDAQVSYSENCLLGIFENEVAIFSIVPNPTSNILQIDTSNGLIPNKVSVFSVEGQLLQTNFNTNTLDISAFASGFYILKAQFEENILTQKFVKK